jgi:ubiquinol-cytochrome c reductase cytochrome c1 subunit
MKKIIIKLIAGLALVMGLGVGVTTGTFAAAEGGPTWDKAPNNLNDLSSMQNGAKLFVNYCLNCHSAAFMRYNRLRDIGLSEQQIKDNLLFSTDKVGETMKAAIDPNQAKDWFGANPPDLTLIARSRSGHGGTGADYLYTYMRTFYPDPTRPTGWNNLVFPNVGMPHVLWQLQGEREPVFAEENVHGQPAQVFKGWKQVTPGSMTPQEYDQAVGDLVGYLQWMAEPAQNSRVRVGVWVLLFLVVFTFFAWRLNAAFWRNIH